MNSLLKQSTPPPPSSKKRKSIKNQQINLIWKVECIFKKILSVLTIHTLTIIILNSYQIMSVMFYISTDQVFCFTYMSSLSYYAPRTGPFTYVLFCIPDIFVQPVIDLFLWFFCIPLICYKGWFALKGEVYPDIILVLIEAGKRNEKVIKNLSKFCTKNLRKLIIFEVAINQTQIGNTVTYPSNLLCTYNFIIFIFFVMMTV